MMVEEQLRLPVAPHFMPGIDDFLEFLFADSRHLNQAVRFVVKYSYQVRTKLIQCPLSKGRAKTLDCT